VSNVGCYVETESFGVDIITWMSLLLFLKHVTDDNLSFIKTAHWRIVYALRNTVQLPQREILDFFPNGSSQAPIAEPH